VSMSGYSVDELRGMPADELFPHGSASNTRCRVHLFLPASASSPATTVLRTKSAGRVHVHLTSVTNLLGQRRQLVPPHSADACRSDVMA
jgi:hypothetical protein